MKTMTKEEQRQAGLSHLRYFQELLIEQGDKASLHLEACHMRSILAAVSNNNEMLQSA